MSRKVRDAAQDVVEAQVRSALRSYLADVRDVTLAYVRGPSGSVLTAAVGDGLPGLGVSAGRWATGVDAGVVEAVRAAFAMVWSRYTDRDLTLTAPALAAMEEYVTVVRDRLVRGTYFGVTVYEESFDAVRRSLAQAVAQGWSREQLAGRIAAELGWEQDGPYWRGVKEQADSQIDGLLDALGEPGTPAREWARLNDPQVARWREERNLAIRHLDAERSVWQTRAELIARTESTGVATFGAEAALSAEGATAKTWVATRDARTRESHRVADGQTVPLGAPFTVGNSLLMRPGDPAGPVGEVAACRCTIIGGD